MKNENEIKMRNFVTLNVTIDMDAELLNKIIKIGDERNLPDVVNLVRRYIETRFDNDIGCFNQGIIESMTVFAEYERERLNL